MALALVGYASVPGSLGDYPAAMAALDEAMAIGEALGDNAVIAAALTNVAIVYSMTGDYERALDTNRRSLALAVAANDGAMPGTRLQRHGHQLRAARALPRRARRRMTRPWRSSASSRPPTCR